MNQIDMKEESLTPFETLASLYVPFRLTQCIALKNEIIICGGYNQNSCYSYHTIKNNYKFICEYPNEINLDTHCVLKMIDNNDTNNKDLNEITLLSFCGANKHTLIMKYKSVWDNENEITQLSNDYNKWIPLMNIGRDEDDYCGMTAIIGGKNNNLLFIVYPSNNVSIFDLNKYQFIKHDILPINSNTNNTIYQPCFISKSDNEMLLFYQSIGLSIKYDEDNNIFEFFNIRVCTTIRTFRQYQYIYVNNFILFFGESQSDEIYKYSIIENKWTKYKQTIPIPRDDYIAILSADQSFIHILLIFEGVLAHVKIELNTWIKDEEEKDEQWMKEEEQRFDIEAINEELEEMKENIDFKKLKKKKEIGSIINQWMRLSLIYKMGWINEFNIIILRYTLFKYFKLLHIFQGHLDRVNSVKFSPDSKKIISTSNDKTIKIWDVGSGNKIKELQGHLASVNDAEFSSDETMVVSCSNDKTIRLWDIKYNTEIQKFEGHTGNVMISKFSPNGMTIISWACDESIRIWNIQSGQMIQILHEIVGLHDILFSPNGQQIVISSYSDPTLVIDIKSGEKTKINCNGFYIVSSLSNRTVDIWNVSSETIIKKFGGYSSIIYVKYFPDKNTVIGYLEDGTIRLWDVQLGVEIQKLNVQTDGIDISPDGNMIVSYSIDGIIQLWIPL
ncbi:WD-40 repeat protein [Reticulomyxa filosa]|uniref:WD-40 repeat protein n=1 Tax=Reticulomyxa filosa TaxID=46433 RepID=X6MJ58_RETFI|nr:WD-40 repeat protein [Reticulomyxa filosa]|eukprot:ETO13462.1 WD-40 repeat protein [Reticulomyxa filosa]